ncbi:MAG: protein kinase [Lachnospiraceae bacterium]|nr:protein kinase [Lachnospiraceae bacterium]
MAYCINCMEEIEDGVKFCPHCGADPKAYEMNKRALQPMTVLNGKYVIGKVLGEGGFGITYLGLDLILKMRVAIKEYFPVQCASRDTTSGAGNDISIIKGEREYIFQKGFEDYVKEARRLASLEELSGIVKVYDFFHANNTAYLVLEYIDGITLKEWFQQGKQNGWKQALELMRPVIRSLATVHRNGIIHRDISPDNIMLRKDGSITLIDFGAAREFANDGKSLTVALKRGFAPPEQYQTHGDQGPWTDVYAICATLYRLISGRVLPDAMSLYSGSQRITPLQDIDPTVPKQLEAALRKGLSARAEERIQDMEELYACLYEDRKVPVKKAPFALWVAVAAGVLAVLVIVIIAVLAGKSGEDKVSDSGRDAEEVDVDEEAGTEDEAGTADKAGTDQDAGVPVSRDEDTEEAGGEQERNSSDTAAAYVAANGLAYALDNMIVVTDNGEGLTVSGTDYMVTEVVLPEEIGGKKITAISGIGSNVTELVLPDSLKTIEVNAFKNCVYLESIYIPAGVEYIGANAFENCASLKEIRISSENKVFRLENGKIVDTNGVSYN